jgi:hypothetical protein
MAMHSIAAGLLTCTCPFLIKDDKTSIPVDTGTPILCSALMGAKRAVPSDEALPRSPDVEGSADFNDRFGASLAPES